MEIVKTAEELRNKIDELYQQGSSIGFVPTMGALHEGHLSLVDEARNDNDFVVCSIFVNPIQFNNADDLRNYPRTLERDIELLNQRNCDLLFAPDEKEIYPEEPEGEFDFGGLDEILEGKYRPGHFRGVALVVKRLFELVRPHRAYFGLKDYQQVLIIHKMTRDLNLPVEIIPCPIVREENGLAMSSRNERLTPEQRKQASIIYDTLKTVKIRSGFSTIKEIKYWVERRFARQKGMKLEYFEICDLYTLQPMKSWAQSNNVIACIAVWVGDVRLIDNMILFS
ncbi:MAG: pantoate--beta-alanine ligase [Bacteroidales bacterium]